MATKQVILVRKDLEMGRGKFGSQVAHAAMAFITRRLSYRFEEDPYEQCITFNDAELDWLSDSFTKVTLKVHSEKELLDLYEKARAAGIEAHFVTDAGRTEFHGIPTITCCAIGPDSEEKIDAITGHLKLYN